MTRQFKLVAENNNNSKTPCQSSSRIIGNFLALLLSFCLGFFLCLGLFLQDGYTTNSVASRQEISRENHHAVNPPAHDVDPPASLERFMEDYWTASQMSYPHLTPMGSRTLQSMRQCVNKNGITVKFPSLPKDLFDEEQQHDAVAATATASTATQRYIAEQFWLQQRGNIYMQHSRKAGGTTLCMTLRLNRHGLVKQSNNEWEYGKRETCQICQFCCDCNLESVHFSINGGFGEFSFRTFPRLLNCVLESNGRNFYESENTVSPPDLLTNPEWGHYVFVSTIRHPISRILSSLTNDQFPSCGKPTPGSTSIQSCGHEAIKTDDVIKNKCNERIYLCYSNYYVRMYAGSYQGEVTQQTMERAKANFERYSCVILQERWEDTAGCLQRRLGLNLSKRNATFNANGKLVTAVANWTSASSSAESTASLASATNLTSVFLEKITPAELDRLQRLNSYDMEFYEWAKERILTEAKHNWDPR